MKNLWNDGIQGLVLMEVAEIDKCKLGALAQRLLMTNSNLSAIIKRMEEHGWIRQCQFTSG